MYEHLKGYDSIDTLIHEQRDSVQQGLNELPQYIDIIKAVAKGKQREYKLGIFVQLANGDFSRYVSYNNPQTGEIDSIHQCTDANEPDFALRVKEKTLIKVVENADEIRRRLDTKDVFGVFSYVSLMDVRPARTKDLLNFRVYASVLLQVLRGKK